MGPAFDPRRRPAGLARRGGAADAAKHRSRRGALAPTVVRSDGGGLPGIAAGRPPRRRAAAAPAWQGPHTTQRLSMSHRPGGAEIMREAPGANRDPARVGGVCCPAARLAPRRPPHENDRRRSTPSRPAPTVVTGLRVEASSAGPGARGPLGLHLQLTGARGRSPTSDGRGRGAAKPPMSMRTFSSTRSAGIRDPRLAIAGLPRVNLRAEAVREGARRSTGTLPPKVMESARSSPHRRQVGSAA